MNPCVITPQTATLKWCTQVSSPMTMLSRKLLMASYHSRKFAQACSLCCLLCGVSIHGIHLAHNFLYLKMSICWCLFPLCTHFLGLNLSVLMNQLIHCLLIFCHHCSVRTPWTWHVLQTITGMRNPPPNWAQINCHIPINIPHMSVNLNGCYFLCNQELITHCCFIYTLMSPSHFTDYDSPAIWCAVLKLARCWVMFRFSPDTIMFC